jgi:hypothetical protein
MTIASRKVLCDKLFQDETEGKILFISVMFEATKVSISEII